MKERPILFSGPMVRAILEGRKTQTRRVVSPKMFIALGADIDDPEEVVQQSDARFAVLAVKYGRCPFGVPGDQLWVRETWAPLDAPGEDQNAKMAPPNARAMYLADHSYFTEPTRWRPSIHMPRSASRLSLEVTGVRIERLQDISEEDAKAEGAELLGPTIGPEQCIVGTTRTHATHPHTLAFAVLWDTINGGRPWKCWDDNPWVWVVEFKPAPSLKNTGGGR